MSSSRHLAAIMFTDLVGYTKIMGNNENKALRLLQKNRKIHKEEIKRFHGKWLKEMGDGVLSRFTTASDAVYCAGAILSRAKKEGITIRIGIHLGEIVNEGGDIFGDGINVASRIETIAKPGSIFISDSVARNVRNKTGVSCYYWKEEHLKNVDEPVRIYRVAVDMQQIPESYNRFEFLRYTKILTAVLLSLFVIIAGFLVWNNDYLSARLSPTTASSLSPVAEKSLAVLPFSNLSNNPDDRYLSEGIAEEIRSHLALIPNMRLISRTSVSRYAGTQKTITEIGREIDTRYILEGSILKGENKVRLSVRLIDSRNDEEIWSNIYDRPLAGIIDAQNDISRKIAAELRLNFVTNPNFNNTIPAEAYNHYLKARHLWQKGDPAGFAVAINHFKKAVDIAPDFALAFAGLADLYLNFAHIGQPSHEVFPKSIEAALRALTINDNLAEAHTSYADCMYHYAYEWEEAESRFEKALRIKPNYSYALWWYSGMLSALGRHDKAIALIEQAIRLDPLNTALIGWSAKTYFWAGNTKMAKERFQKTRSLLPAGMTMIPYLWLEYYQSANPPDIISLLEKKVHTISFNISARTALALAYIDRGKSDKAALIARSLVEQPDLTQPHYLALIYSALGDKEAAFATLEEAYQKRDAALIWINVNPGFDMLKDDPRFDDLLKRMNLL